MSDPDVVAGEARSGYAAAVGVRLRLRRRALGMSLTDVEVASGREFKASVLGAYERGERMISVLRLQRLSEIYQINVDRLLPAHPQDGVGSSYRLQVPNTAKSLSAEQAVVYQYARAVRAERSDKGSGVITLRADDLRLLAGILGRDVEEIADRFLAIPPD